MITPCSAASIFPINAAALFSALTVPSSVRFFMTTPFFADSISELPCNVILWLFPSIIPSKLINCGVFLLNSISVISFAQAEGFVLFTISA